MLPTASIVLVGECAVSHLPFSGIPLPFSPAFQWHSTAFSPCLSLAFHCRFPPAFSLAFHCLFAALHRHFSAFLLPFIGISLPFCWLATRFIHPADRLGPPRHPLSAPLLPPFQRLHPLGSAASRPQRPCSLGSPARRPNDSVLVSTVPTADSSSSSAQ